MIALLLVAATVVSRPAHAQQAEPTLPISQRQTINLAAGVPQYIGNAATTSNAPQSNWLYEDSNGAGEAAYSTQTFVESSDTQATWNPIGLPYDANAPRTYINQVSGGGQGSLNGNDDWYRLHFKVDPKYAGQKFLLDVEGAHTGVRIYINGVMMPNASAVTDNAGATHVDGFIPVAVDLTPYITADGTTDNVIAIDVSSGSPWFVTPDFSQAFRFMQAMRGLFRNVYLYVSNPIHIPPNVYSNLGTWGVYAGTVSEVQATQGTATAASALVDVQTNVLNETAAAQQVTLTTQIVDEAGNVVATQSTTQTVPSMPTKAAFPSSATPEFDQQITVQNPTLWYPNGSVCGTPAVSCGSPYLYKIYSIVSANGEVVDSVQTTLGIRTITWDANFAYFNGYPQHMWGAGMRYDYPGFAAGVPDEQVWRDVALLAAQGGNILRPGHSPSSEELVEACDAYGVMIDQPSGDGEGGWNPAATPPATPDDLQLKQEVHRDMIIRDRSHPSILDWERDNGGMGQTLADELQTIENTWDDIAPRKSADRTYSPSFGFLDECDGAGCEIANKQQFPNNPAFGAEYWDNSGSGRGTTVTVGGVSISAYDYELADLAPYLDDWRRGRLANTEGVAQWYLAEEPGEVSTWLEFANQPLMFTNTPGDPEPFVRSLGYSSTDANRFPRLLYYAYAANWLSYSIKPVVHLAHHWNRAYEYTQGTPIQENAFSNCPSVRLLINGVPNDPVTGALLQDQTPNNWETTNSSSNLTQNTTVVPGQVSWMVNWAPGTVTAECIDENGNPVANVTDSRTTAGAEYKIVLTAVPDVTAPDGTTFQWTANGSDPAFVVAQVQDANGNWVPTAQDNVTFSVSGPATYEGGTQQLVSDPQWTSDYQDAFSIANNTVIQGVPYGFFHSPGDHELNFEGGLQKIALRSGFTAGQVTVTASASGLISGSVTLTSVTPPGPMLTQAPAIIVPPMNVATTVGFPATFVVAASGSGQLSYQWSDRNGPIAGATSPTYTTPPTTMEQNGDTFTVTVTSDFGTVTSNPAVTLTVDPAAAVQITTQPVSQAIVVGQSATLSVVATGSAALSYQWYQVGSGLIPGATQPTYTTPVFTALPTTGTQGYYVVVTNPLGSMQSNTAAITVNAPIPVSIVTQPVSSIIAPVNEPEQLSVTVAGSTPYTYSWQFTPTGGSATILGGSAQTSTPTITYTIPAMSAANVGTYTVTVNNAANAPVTSAAAQLTLAPPGVNLALFATATASSDQGPNCTDPTTMPPFSGLNCLGPENAVDGNVLTRWGSAVANAAPTPPVAGVDPSWLQVDFGSAQSFNTVIIDWQAAYATQYQIQYTNGDPTVEANWLTAATNLAGQGGTEQLPPFPTVSARYIRLLGEQRATQYGYSVNEFQVYNVPQCGASTERYTINNSNPNLSLVTDNLTGLTWTRTVETDTAPGSQFTGVDAQQYCSSIGMRLPTQTEALQISGNNNASCAFPGVWSTWTSTVDPDDSTKTSIVNFDGTSSFQPTGNFPGATLCDSGTDAGAAPTITTQPAGQTVTVGQAATFSVTATGSGALSYQWIENGTPITGATSSSYTTPATTSSDNNEVFSVSVSDPFGMTASNPATLIVQTITCTVLPSTPGTLIAGSNASSQVNLTWTASTAPTSCPITYAIYRSTTAGFTPSSANQIATTTATTYSDTTAAPTTTYFYFVEAVDGAGSSAASNPASATTPEIGCTSNCGSDVIAISAGGPGAGAFSPDEDFVGGTPSGTTANINTSGVTNPAPESVYQNDRFGNSIYTLTGFTPGTNYVVRLHFAEFYWTSAGQRLFNVSINGTQVLTNFDMFAAAGGENIAIVEQFAATANPQGQIVLQFTTVKDNAAINGIEVQMATAANTPPNAPSNLAATAASSSQINLSWTGSSTAGATYTVFRNGTAVANGLTGTTFSDTGLTAFTTYSYTIEAVNPAGPSLASNTATATTFDVNCASGCGSDVLDISAGGPGAGSYVADEFFNGGTGSNTGSTINTSGVTNPAPQSVYQNQRVGNTFTYTLPGLTPGATYTVRLHFAEIYWTEPGQRVFNVAINGAMVLNNFDIIAATGGQDIAIAEPFTVTANSQGQIVLQFTTTTNNAVINGIEVIAAAPAAPTNLTATETSSTQINLNWTASTAPGVVYDVFRSTTPDFTPSSANQIATATATSYSDSGLTANTTYYYVVEASNASGTSAPTAQASATTTGLPAAPTNLMAAAVSSSQINLGWTASATSGVTYTVLRNGAVVANNLMGTTYSDIGLTASTTYTYVVEAVNSTGASPASNTAMATTASAAPVAPTNLTATPASSSQINLGWTASATSGVNYTVLRNGSSVASKLMGTTYSDTGLTASTQYSYVVQAVNSVGASPASNTATATTSAAACTSNCSPDAIAISAGGPAAGDFSADEDFSGGTAFAVGSIINTSGVTNPAPQSVYQHQRYGNFTYTLPGLTPGGSYTVRLHFDEFYFNAPGQRVFNVSINGAQVLSNFDVFAAAGGENIAIVEPFTATANSQGQIVLQFTTVTNNAEINGIEVLSASGITAPTNLTAAPASSSQINLGWTASSTSGVTYTVLRNASSVAANLTGTAYSDTGLTASTQYSYTVLAVNSSGASSASNTTTATTSAAGCSSNCGADVIAISAGGPAAGNFAADEDFSGGTAFASGSTINTSGVTNPAPQSVYQHQRYGNFTYTLPGLTPGGSYTVRLHFDEFYFNGPNLRVFNVSINGAQVLSNFDVFAAAGGENVAIVEQFSATANSQGQIVVQFTTVTNNAEVNGIEVLSASGTTAPSQLAAPVFTPTPGTYSAAQNVAISDATVSATIYYTTNGTAPTTASSVYSSPIQVNTNETIQAIAVLSGETNSPVASGIYVINAATGSGGAPTINTAPLSQTVTIGRTATFSVIANAGSGSALTYQWYKNGTAIPGATNATYTTPGTTAPDNASSYTVMVSNGGNSVTSSPAILSINLSPTYTVVPNSIVTDLNNNTNGVWADNQIYVEILGLNPSTGALSWVNYDGTITPALVSDNTAPNALVGPGGQTYPNYSFTLAQSHQLILPPLSAARIYISYGNPMYMPIQPPPPNSNAPNGFAGANPQNPTDPNINTHFDWYEFSYAQNGGIFINTTQVNEFGLPLLLDVWGSQETFHMQVGINESIAQIDQEYAQLPVQFQPPTISNLRILSPAESSMAAGATYGNYFDSTIAKAWASYATTPLTITSNGRQFVSTESGSTLTFTEINPAAANVGEVFTVMEPSTQDILECAGTMATGVAGNTDENNIQLQLENQICAATNRGVLLTPANWANAATYYQTAPYNFYSQFWHQHSVGGWAYGFSFDDNNNQSSTIQAGQPEHMAFGLGW